MALMLNDLQQEVRTLKIRVSWLVRVEGLSSDSKSESSWTRCHATQDGHTWWMGRIASKQKRIAVSKRRRPQRKCHRRYIYIGYRVHEFEERRTCARMDTIIHHSLNTTKPVWRLGLVKSFILNTASYSRFLTLLRASKPWESGKEGSQTRKPSSKRQDLYRPLEAWWFGPRGWTV